MQNEINCHLNRVFDVFRNAEISKRKSFIAEYGMLPVDLVSGLTKMPGLISIRYAVKNELLLPQMADDGRALHELCCEFEALLRNEGHKWKWNYDNSNTAEEESNSSSSSRQNSMKNMQQIAVERNKWERDKLVLIKEYESKLSELSDKTGELESENADLK
eukprot:156981_1